MVAWSGSYFAINGQVLDGRDADGTMWGVTDVEGWDGTTDPTLVLEQKARASGATGGDSFSGPRTIAITGWVKVPSPAMLSLASDRLNAAVPRGPATLLAVEAGRSRTATVRRGRSVIFTSRHPRYATWSISVKSKDWRKFAAELSAFTFLPSTAGGLTIPATHRRNLLPNPRPASLTGYTSPNGAIGYAANELTVTLATGGVAETGGAFPNLTVGTELLPLTEYTASMKVFVPAASPHVRAYATGAGAVFASGVASATKDSYVTISVTFTTTASGTVQILILNVTSATAGQTFKIKETLFEIGASVGSFFSGATTDTDVAGYSWAGTADASASDALLGGLTIPFTIASTLVSGQVNLSNDGNEVGPVRLRIDGPVTGPTVVHSSGRSLVFSSSLVLGAGEWLDIDMDRHTVLANGQSSRSAYLTSRGWSGFDRGLNTWSFSAAVYNAASKLTVFAKPADE